jgi:hypothetical protein
MEPQFAPALSRLQFLLSRAAHEAKTPIRFALMDGLSLAAWGVVRATQDIDFLADSEPSPIGTRPFAIDSKPSSTDNAVTSRGASATMTIRFRSCSE